MLTMNMALEITTIGEQLLTKLTFLGPLLHPSASVFINVLLKIESTGKGLEATFTNEIIFSYHRIFVYNK